MRRASIPVLVAVASAAWAQDDARDRLLASPAHDADSRRPEFREIDLATLRAAFRVVSGRSHALVGFNAPEVRVHFPDADNGSYAEIEMGPPELVDAAGNAVPFELERGIYDHDARADEVRFRTPSGDGSVSFARARGEVRVRYPLVITTRTVRKGDGDSRVALDGPYVLLDPTGVPEAQSFSPFEPVRAFDAAGKQLKRSSSLETRIENGRETRRLGFHGAVERVEIDTVTRVATVTASYDLPPAEPLPESRAGMTPDEGAPVAETPGGVVRVLAALVTETRAAASLGAPVELPPARTAPAPAPPSDPPAPEPAPPAPPPPAPKGPPIPIPDPSTLSPEARKIAAAVEAFHGRLGKPRVSQFMAFGYGVVHLAVPGSGGVEVHEYREGALEPAKPAPSVECQGGVAPDRFDIDRMPAIWDDAARRAGLPVTDVLQIVAYEYPCGTPNVRVALEGRVGAWYSGDGRFLRIER